jgi:predicted nuclease of predicted toxin-antitoxin system
LSEHQVKFLIDAQLPRRLTFRLREAGHDAWHTLDLPTGNRTPDADIIAVATRDDRIVVTKDADFVESFVLFHTPPKLLLISTGNIRNSDLEALFVTALAAIVAAFATYDFVEMTRTALILHS